MAKVETPVVEIEKVLLETNGEYKEVGIDEIDFQKVILAGLTGSQRVFRTK